MFIARIFFSLVIMITSVSVLVHAEGENLTSNPAPVELSFVGQVTAIDWVASKISIRSEFEGKVDEKVFLVPQGLVIARGVDTISLEDMNISDNVVIRYTVDPNGNLNIVSMIVIEP